VVHGNADLPAYLRQILPHGFETFQITFGHNAFDHALDLERLGRQCQEVLAGSGATFSALSVFGNPVANDAAGTAVREGWKKLVENAHHFGAGIISGFCGGLDGRPVPESVPAVAEVFRPIVKRAAERGLRIAFENCPMGGTWGAVKMNTATSAAAWELLFAAMPDANLGLEWEPCHQMIELVDVLAQARQWAPRIFHIQGKCATIAHDILRVHGRNGGRRWNWHRTPGFGDLDWTDLISILRQAKWQGSIDIEGWHDPVYNGDLEMTGQVHGLHYLKQCRGGTFVPNPVI
jgi:sugar phosphate isomerase/epimerase